MMRLILGAERTIGGGASPSINEILKADSAQNKAVVS
jgi:hypothetical protein